MTIRFAATLPWKFRVNLPATLLLVPLWVVSPPAIAVEVVSWGGNTLEWNRRLGVTEIRIGCSLKPTACVLRAASAARQQQLNRATLAIATELDNLAADAREYSELSRYAPVVVGVGIDDFHSQLRRWLASQPLKTMRVLVQVLQNLKAHNPELNFGITLYEDDLDGVALRLLPVEVREGINRVSLYLHYRAAGTEYADFVAATRRLFPNAQILAGVYAYDRIDYLPCASSASRACTANEERALFESTAKIQEQLIRSHELAGIEFYPGRFGQEAEWDGWNAQRICASNRRTECLAQTRRLSEVAARILGAQQFEAGP